MKAQTNSSFDAIGKVQSSLSYNVENDLLYTKWPIDKLHLPIMILLI